MNSTAIGDTASPHFSSYWKIVIPASGTILLSSLTGGMSGDLFNLFMTEGLGWSASTLSWIYLVMLASFPIQLLGPSIARRTGYSSMMGRGLGVLAACNISMLLAVWFIDAPMTQLVVLGCLVVLVEVAYSLSFGTVWGAWISQLIQREKRPKLFAFAKVLSQSVMIATFAAQTVFSAGEVNKVFYSILLALILIYLLTSGFPVRSLPKVDEVGDHGRGLIELVREIPGDFKAATRTRHYRTFVIDSVLQPFIGVPLLAVFLMQIVQTAPEYVSMALLLKSGASILTMLAISRIGEKLNPYSAVLGSATVVIIVLSGWFLLITVGHGSAAQNFVPLVLVPLMFSAKSLYSVMVAHLAVDVVDEKDRLSYYTLTDIFSSASVQMANSFGGVVIAVSLVGATTEGQLPVAAIAWIIAGAAMSIFLLRRYRAMAKSFNT